MVKEVNLLVSEASTSVETFIEVTLLNGKSVCSTPRRFSLDAATCLLEKFNVTSRTSLLRGGTPPS